MSVVGISRSISACKRCRNKKIKCSQEFPKCKGCIKAGEECVSLDAATGKEIPRSYILFLETKIKQLEEQLKNPKDGKESNNLISPAVATESKLTSQTILESDKKHDVINKPQSKIPTSNNISFSKLMFTAVHYGDGKVNSKVPSQIKIDPTSIPISSQSNRTALLPPKQQALDFIYLYFSKSNSQLPIFHRIEFLEKYFIPIYGSVPKDSNLLKDFKLTKHRMKVVKEKDTWYYQYLNILNKKTKADPNIDPFEFSANVKAPAEFKIPLFFVNIVFAISSSVYHLQFPEEISENFKNSALVYVEDAYSNSNRLEALQGMLCLTLFSLMRPCVPGVWYLLGASLRLCVDLNLHNEYHNSSSSFSAFVLDLRRRLFWCCYSLDRQICVYLNRPFGIPEESINVNFFSLLDDELINEDSTSESLMSIERQTVDLRSYKLVSITMIRIRQLQAEIQSILYEKKEIPRSFPNLTAWLIDIDSRLDNWKSSINGIIAVMDCEFTTEFFDLNYFHAKIMLNGLSPNRYVLTDRDLSDAADAAKSILSIFHSLLGQGALNYTWAVTQNVFTAQMSYLYSIFNSNNVKNENTVEEFIKYFNYASSILKSLLTKCNASGECLQILSILSQAILKLKYNVTLDADLDTTSISESMQRIPSEKDVQDVQAGGNMNANMKKLIVSIPELITGKHQNDSKEDLSGGERKRRKLETDIGRVNNINYINDFDINRFFDKVQTVETPHSTRSSTYIPPTIADTNHRIPTCQPNHYLDTPSQPQYDSYGTPSSAFSHNLCTNTNGVISDIRSSSNVPQISNLASSYPTTQFSPYEIYPNSNYHGSSFNGSPMENTSNDFNPGLTNQYSNLIANKPSATERNPESRAVDKEGSMVYRMMYEAGTESIWNQFFAQTFKSDDV